MDRQLDDTDSPREDWVLTTSFNVSLVPFFAARSIIQEATVTQSAVGDVT